MEQSQAAEPRSGAEPHPGAQARVPPAQYLAPELVMGEMAEFGRHRIVACSVPQILVLGLLGGAFITAGALFVAANFQHSPANMGYFSLIMPSGGGPGWASALLWNVIPVGLGNMIGGTLLVALPLRFALSSRQLEGAKRRVRA